jgi:hypothetical protein
VQTDLRGWRTMPTERAEAMTLERDGWRIQSDDGKKFRVVDPSETVICEDLGSAFEARRVADSAIRRAQK